MLEFYFRFQLLHLRHHRHAILHQFTKFRPNRTIRDTAKTSYAFFSRWRTRHRNSTSGFVFRFSWLRSFGKVELYLQTKFRQDISIHGWDITTSGFLKQTSAMLKFYFRFQFSPLNRHRHVILHLPTKLRPDRTIHDIVMTSYPFFKMVARASQFYFWFRFCNFAQLGRSKSICRPNFGEISQSTAEILLLPVSENKTPAMLEFYFRFRFVRLRHHRNVILHLPTKFRPNRTIGDRVMTSYAFFSRWRPSAILNFVKSNCRPKYNWGLRLVLKFRLDRIYSFVDIAIFVLSCFGLKLPIYVVVSAAHAQNEGLIYFRGRNWSHILIHVGRFAYLTSNFQMRSWLL